MPRLGVGMPITAGLSQEAVTTIDDFFFESQTSGEVTPFATADRTNRLAYSEDFSQSGVYGFTNVTVATNTTTAPDGTSTADTVTPTTTNGIHTLSMTGTNTVAMSVFAKANGYNMFRFNTGSSSNGRATFDLSDGTIHATSGTFFSKASIEDHGNGWYRCSCVIVGGSATNMTIAIEDGSDSVSFAADGTSGIHFWGAQSEDNTETTAYIPTTSSTVTVTPALSDTSEVWDFDTRDLMLEADPEDEGFWEEGSNLVTNHDYEDLGSELVTNGGFDTDSNWTFAGTNGAVSNGVGVFADTTNSYIIQSSVVPASVKQYKLQYEVIESNGGSLGLSGGSSAFGAVNLTSSVGVHTKFITSNGSQTNLQFNNQTSFIGKIDNISVKQVDPNDRWTLSNTTISDGVLNFPDNSSAAKYAVHTNTSMMDIGGAYEITLTVNKTSGGVLKVLSGTGASDLTPSISISSSGTQTFRVTNDTNGSKLFLYTTAGENFQGTVDNITVREYAIQPQDV